MPKRSKNLFPADVPDFNQGLYYIICCFEATVSAVVCILLLIYITKILSYRNLLQ
jgi:hypothetical protein